MDLIFCYMLDHFPNEKIVNLDKVTYAADLTTIESLSTYDNYTFVKGDICDQSLIQELFNRHAFTGVIHFAAEVMLITPFMDLRCLLIPILKERLIYCMRLKRVGWRLPLRLNLGLNQLVFIMSRRTRYMEV